MSINRSYILAAVAVVVIGLWFLLNSGDVGGNVYDDIEARETGSTAETVKPTVVIRPIVAEEHTIRLTTYGRTQPNRMVELKAKTPASLVATPLTEGSAVERGAVLCRQDTDARQAMVDQATAQLAKAEADLSATETLVEKGYRSPTQLNADRAARDSARAQLKQAEIELGNIVLRAPFSGIYEKRLAEVGDYLSPGQPCAMLVELNPLKVQIELTETQVGQVESGQSVQVRLATGETVEGTVSYIETVANPATRTFEMETLLPNDDYSLKAGVSATVSLATGQAMAARVPSGILTIDDDGTTGIRYVDNSDTVRFAAVTLIDETEDGIWVTGLPDRTRIIVKGQDYVAPGTQVIPRSETEANLNTGPQTPVARLSTSEGLE